MPSFSRSTSDAARSRSMTRAGALVVAVGALLVIGVISVVQASLPTNTTFKLDGTYNGGGSGTDWSNASGVTTFTDGTGGNDDIFWTGGSKDVRPIEEWAWKTGPTPSQKTDLANVLVRTQDDGSGDLIAYFAARRVSSLGNAKIGFWILQDAVGPVSDTATSGHFSGSHEDGDILVDIDWTTGAIQTNGIKAYAWDSDETRNGPKRLTNHMLPDGTFGDCKTVTRANVTVCATVNTTTISSPWGNLAPGTFIEGAVNLTETFGITELGCRPTILAETRSSGSSVTSALEDFVGASLSACSLTIRKSATDNTSTDFDFSTGGLTPASFQLRNAQYRTWSGLDNSAYTVTEVAKAGWTLTSLTCTNSGDADVQINGATVSVDYSGNRVGRVDCTYVNRRLPTVTVVKDVVPDDTTAQFALKVDDTTHTTTATDGTSVGPFSIPTGVHTVSETDGSGAVDLSTYTTNIGCRKAGAGADYTTATGLRAAERMISLGSLAYGDQVTCTIVNTRIATMRITKVLDPTTDTAARFLFTVDSTTFGGPGGYGHLGSTGYFEVSTGTRTVGERSAGSTVLADYTTGIACSTNGGDLTDYEVSATTTYRRAQVVVSTGDTIDCYITNTALPKVTIQKISTGSTGTFHWDITGGSGLPDFLDLTTVTTGVMVSGPTWTLERTDGTYTITEALTPGFISTDITCGAAVSATISTGDRSVTITDPGPGAVITCLYTNSGPFSTRTQGFWSTHPEITWKVWEGTSGTWPLMTYWTPMTSGDRTFCNGERNMTFDKTVSMAAIPGNDPVLGGFWADVSKMTVGGTRSPIDQARMRLAQQLLAAVLNHHLFGSVPTGDYTIDEAKAAFCGSDVDDINDAAAAMAYFNEHGDNGLLTPGGSAKPRYAYKWANRSLWNTPTDF